MSVYKTVLTKELGEGARLVYVIRMENTYGNTKPFTENIPSNSRPNVRPQDVDAPLSSFTSELKIRLLFQDWNLQVESQLNPNYNFENFLEETRTVWLVLQPWPLQTSRGNIF